MDMTPICEGKGCPIRDDCMRYNRPIMDMRTRYEFLSPPYRDGECSEFIRNNKSEQSLR